jgi:hypothetical protein
MLFFIFQPPFDNEQSNSEYNDINKEGKKYVRDPVHYKVILIGEEIKPKSLGQCRQKGKQNHQGKKYGSDYGN